MYSLDTFEEVKQGIYGGSVTPEQALAALDELIENKELVLAQLAKKTKKDLVGKYWANREKKPACVRRAWRNMLQLFLLGNGYSFGFGEDIDRAIITQAKAACADAEQLRVFAEKRAEQVKWYSQAITDPQTLDQFEWLIAYHKKGEGALTAEQQKRYDELKAGSIVERRERDQERQADVRQFTEEMPLELVDAYHSKKNVPLYVVSLTERVETDLYRELKRKAKQFGGWYSRYNKNGAVPGFQFYEKEDAEAFMSLAKGDASALERWQRREQEKQENAVLRLRDIADRLERGGDSELERERRVNTPRRVRMAQTAEDRARQDKALAGTLRNLADAIEAGTATHLDKVRFMSDVLTLESIARRAQYTHAHQAAREDGDYRDWDEIRRRGPSEDDLYHTEYPMPSFYLHYLEDAVRYYTGKPGYKLLCRRLQKAVDAAHAAGKTYVRAEGSRLIEDIQSLVSKARKTYVARKASYTIESLAGALMDWKRLQRMDLTNISLLREALREYLVYRNAKDAADPVVEAERALVGLAIPGFFPTPVEVAMTMATVVEIGPEDRVLEPQAGSGRLADAARTVSGVTPDCCEVNYTLRELLELKGHNLVATDFLRYEPEQKYNVILANPPFSGGEDVKHFQHALDCLAPGGRMAIIMGMHPFFGSDMTSRSFRRTLERSDLVEIWREDLPAGTFETTNTPAVLLVIKKLKD